MHIDTPPEFVATLPNATSLLGQAAVPVNLNPSASSGLSNMPNMTSQLDQSFVMNIVQQLKSTIFAEVRSLFAEVILEVRNDRDQIRKLKEHVTELTAIIITTASAIFIKQQASKPTTKEVHRKLCLLPMFFNDNFMLKVLPKVVICFLARSVIRGSIYLELELKVIESLSVLHFSKQPNETKNGSTVQRYA